MNARAHIANGILIATAYMTILSRNAIYSSISVPFSSEQWRVLAAAGDRKVCCFHVNFLAARARV